MSEVLFLVGISIVGLAGLLPLRKHLKDWQIIFLAPLIGQIVWVAAGLLWLLSPVYFSPRRLFFALMWVAALALGAAMRKGASPVLGLTGATVALVASVAALIIAANPSTVTNDSFWLITIGHALANTGFESEPSLIVLRSFPLFPSLVQSAAVMMKAEYLVAAPAVFNIFGLVSIFGTLAEDLRALGSSRRKSIVLSALAFMAIVTAVLVTFQVFYIRGNLEFAITLTLFVIAIRRWALGQVFWAPLAVAMLTATTLLRVEAPVLILPYVTVFLLLPTRAPQRGRTVLASFYALLIAGLYAGLILDGEGAVLDEFSIAAIVITALLLPLLSFAAPRLRPKLRTFLVRLIVPGVLAVAVFVTAARPEWMLEGGWNTLKNLLLPTHGLWGGLWIFVSIAALILWWMGQAPSFQTLFVVPILANLLTVYCLGFFSSYPWEPGWAASQNRLLVAVLLPVIYVVMLRAAPLLVNHQGGPRTPLGRDPERGGL